MKNFEADLKRLASVKQNLEEKKPDLAEEEKKDRLDIIQMTRDVFSMFKVSYNEQTSRFEKGLSIANLSINHEGDTSAINETNISKLNNHYTENETQ